MQKMFDQFTEISQSNAPKELIREYETPEGDKVRGSRTNSIWIFNDYWA